MKILDIKIVRLKLTGLTYKEVACIAAMHGRPMHWKKIQEICRLKVKPKIYRTCQQCYLDFEVDCKGRYRKFCSKECLKAWRNLGISNADIVKLHKEGNSFLHIIKICSSYGRLITRQRVHAVCKHLE